MWRSYGGATTIQPNTYSHHQIKTSAFEPQPQGYAANTSENGFDVLRNPYLRIILGFYFHTLQDQFSAMYSFKRNNVNFHNEKQGAGVCVHEASDLFAQWYGRMNIGLACHEAGLGL